MITACWGIKSLFTVISVARRSSRSEQEEMSWHAGSKDIDPFTINTPWPLSMFGVKLNSRIQVQGQSKDTEPNLNESSLRGFFSLIQHWGRDRKERSAQGSRALTSHFFRHKSYLSRQKYQSTIVYFIFKFRIEFRNRNKQLKATKQCKHINDLICNF